MVERFDDGKSKAKEESCVTTASHPSTAAVETAQGPTDSYEAAERLVVRRRALSVDLASAGANKLLVVEVVKEMVQRGYLAGLPLAPLNAGDENDLLIAVTEKRTREQLDGFAAALKAVACS